MNKITIKFGTELKPAKHIVVYYNFTKAKDATIKEILRYIKKVHEGWNQKNSFEVIFYEKSSQWSTLGLFLYIRGLHTI